MCGGRGSFVDSESVRVKLLMRVVAELGYRRQRTDGTFAGWGGGPEWPNDDQLRSAAESLGLGLYTEKTCSMTLDLRHHLRDFQVSIMQNTSIHSARALQIPLMRKTKKHEKKAPSLSSTSG